MAMRSWLFVPGDSEKKLSKVLGAGADVVVVDLEDSVAAEAKKDARVKVRDFLELQHAQVIAGERKQCWVRINALSTPLWREDMAAIMPGKPDGIMVPKATGPEQLRALSSEIYELEQKCGATNGATKIMPMLGETPLAALNIPHFGQDEHQQPRIAGLTWGAEDLSISLLARRKRDETGNWTGVFSLVRAQLLLAARASHVAAIDTLYADFKDMDGLERIAKSAFLDGYTGMLAIHPKQVAIINKAFTPDKEDVERAQAIVDAFAADPAAGALQLDGEMIEIPHLLQARALLEQAG